MAKTITNVLKTILSKIEIGTSANGSEPGTYTEIGFADEAALILKLVPVNTPTADGGNIQDCYDCSAETTSLEILNLAALEAFRNTYVWLKGTPTGTVSASNPIVRAKNFLCNLEVQADLSAKGKSFVKITGKVYAAVPTDFFTTAAS
jgi:hypothetical protein